MTGVIMENILLSAIVCIEILGLLTWAILSSRASRSSARRSQLSPPLRQSQGTSAAGPRGGAAIERSAASDHSHRRRG